VIELIQSPSATQINAPWLIVLLVNPNDVINDAPFLSKHADTTQSKLTTNPRNCPVFALVFETTVHPVYPAENADAEMLILIKRF
jgi:hypothetical protein